MELRTLRSEHFQIKPKQWWRPSVRKAARLSLKVMESHVKEHEAEMQRRSMDLLLYGTAYCEAKYDIDLSSGER